MDGINHAGEIVAHVGKDGELIIGDTKRHFKTEDQAMAEAERIFTNKGNSMKEILQDAKGFIHDNRNVIYWVALAFLADHFFFNGAFRDRLNALVEKMIGRVEKQLEASTK